MVKSGADVPEVFCCAATGLALYLPVITTQGIAYSYSALFEMFMTAPGLPICKVTGQQLAFFPSVCRPLHHFMLEEYRPLMKARRQQDEVEMRERFGFQMPQIEDAPEQAGDQGLLDELECAVSRALVYEPCVLSSGTIVSAYCVPDGGFDKDPDRTVRCALYGQAPRKCAALEALLKARFPQQYLQRGLDLAKDGIRSAGRFAVGTWSGVSPALPVFLGLGCDGCGLWPIRGAAWEDADCKDKAGFHLCDACCKLGYHRRIITGKCNQSRLPSHRMVQLAESDFF